MPAHSANGRGGKHLALPELPDLQQPVMPEKPVKAHVVPMIDYFTKAAEFYTSYKKKPQAVRLSIMHG